MIETDNFPHSSTKTVMLIDDQTLYRNCLANLITKQDHLSVIAQSEFSEQTLDLAESLMPEIILADPCLNHTENIPFISGLVERCGNSRVLLISSPCSSDFYFDFIRAGVSGIVLKTQNPEIVINAIDRILQNELWFDRSILTSVFEEVEKPKPKIITKPETVLGGLTKRELEIVNLVVNGQNTSSIAKKLRISEKTVRNHIYSIYGKLEVKDRLELSRFATRNGVLPDFSS